MPPDRREPNIAVLIAAAVGPPLAFGWAAGLGLASAVLTLLSVALAALLRNYANYSPRQRALVWILAFWLLPESLAVAPSFFAWRRSERARPGSAAHGSDARAIWRPVVVFFAIVAWLASRPPHASGAAKREALAACVLGGLAALTGVLLLAADVAGALATRASIRRAESKRVPTGAWAKGTALVDFGIGDEIVEIAEHAEPTYRTSERVSMRFRGSGPAAAAILARSAAWSAAAATLALLAAAFAIPPSVATLVRW